MRELIPLVAGLFLGVVLSRWPGRLHPAAVVVACLVIGFLASAVNGELESSVWPAFVSFDSALVWLGAAAAAATIWLARRLNERSVSAEGGGSD